MKYYVISDIHAYYDNLMDVIEKTDFDPSNPTHKFVCLGNLLDRGNQPKECLAYITTLLSTDSVILVQGNYDLSVNEAMKRGYFTDGDRSNGTVDTAKLITGMEDEQVAMTMLRSNINFRNYMNALLPYYETKNNIFISGWIPCYKIPYMTKSGEFFIKEPDWRNAPEKEWFECAWYNGMKVWSYGIREADKTIICGSVPTSWGHYNLHREGGRLEDIPEGEKVDFNSPNAPICTPFVDDGIICIEGGTAHGMQMNCILVEDDPLDEFNPTKMIAVDSKAPAPKQNYPKKFFTSFV